MSTLPYFKFYTNDWLADTAILSATAKGCYIDILAISWSKRAFPRDDDTEMARLLRLTKSQWRKVKTELEPFFFLENGTFFNKRLAKLLQESEEKTEKMKTISALGVEARALKRNKTALPHGNRTVNQMVKKSQPILELELDKKEKIDKKESARRGSRLSDDWQPSETNIQFALSKLRTLEQVENETSKFRNYYQSVSGKKAIRIDWQKTFNNWIRSNYCTRPDSGTGAGSLTAAISEISDAIQNEQGLRSDRLHDDATSELAGLRTGSGSVVESLRAIKQGNGAQGTNEAQVEDNNEKHGCRGTENATRRLHR